MKVDRRVGKGAVNMMTPATREVQRRAHATRAGQHVHERCDAFGQGRVGTARFQTSEHMIGSCQARLCPPYGSH